MKAPSAARLMDLSDTAWGIIRDQSSSLNVKGRLVSLPEKGEAVIIGDLHGDIKSLNRIIKDSTLENKLRNEDQYLICLGDYIDRGPSQIQVIFRLLSLLEKYPNQVILLRGNHEGPFDLKVRVHESLYDFRGLLYKTYGYTNELENRFMTLFNSLYTACEIENQALLVHGGIPIEATTLSDIAYAHESHPDCSYLAEILWNDPSTLHGKHHSFRGVGWQFGVDLASLFLDKNGLKVLIRGHESYDAGYHFHDGRVLTLFSCKLPVYRNPHLAYLSIPLDIEFTKQNLQEHIQQL